MTLESFLKQFENCDKELLQKEVVVVTPNGLLTEPKIKFEFKEKYTLDHSPDNIERIVLSWD